MRRLLTWSIVLASSSFLSSCLCSNLKTNKVRMGLNAWPGYELLHLAKEKGFFKEEGIDAEIIEFASLSDTRRAFERGQIDIMPGTMIEMLLSRKESNRKATAIIAADYSDGADVIIARSGIASMGDLKGKRIGYEAGTLNLVLLKFGLATTGIDFSDIQTVNLPQDQGMLQELKTGAVDAVVTYPPMSIEILKEIPDTRAIFSSKEESAREKIIDIIAADEDYIAQNPNIIAGIKRAYFKAERFTQQNNDEAFQIMAKRENISPEDFKTAYTDGLVVLKEEQQGQYLKAGGTIDTIAPQVIEALVATKQMEGEIIFDRITYWPN